MSRFKIPVEMQNVTFYLVVSLLVDSCVEISFVSVKVGFRVDEVEAISFIRPG